MTNKDALEALNWINWKIEETYKLGIERVPVYETIRKALEVNQELVEALKIARVEFNYVTKNCAVETAIKSIDEAIAAAEKEGV